MEWSVVSVNTFQSFQCSLFTISLTTLWLQMDCQSQPESFDILQYTWEPFKSAKSCPGYSYKVLWRMLTLEKTMEKRNFQCWLSGTKLESQTLF